MFDAWSPTALLVHGAALTYVIGFLVREQLVLRGLMQVGSILYIAYYYIHPETPLWDAIAWTAVMFVANAWTIFRILKDRRVGTFDEEDLIVYSAIRHIAPGDFRRLMAKAQKAGASAPLTLTEEGGVPDTLWFIVSGEATLEKRGAQRRLSGPMFIGEIAYLLNQPASARVTLDAGGRYAAWSVADLRSLISRNPSIGAALDSAFNQDLAAKVAAS
jgi:hypothetical protein